MCQNQYFELETYLKWCQNVRMYAFKTFFFVFFPTKSNLTLVSETTFFVITRWDLTEKFDFNVLVIYAQTIGLIEVIFRLYYFEKIIFEKSKYFLKYWVSSLGTMREILKIKFWIKNGHTRPEINFLGFFGKNRVISSDLVQICSIA